MLLILMKNEVIKSVREVKYRAWDKKRKEMFPVHELGFDRNCGKLVTIKGYIHDEKDVWDVYGGHKMMYASESRYELLEYTGLKDKNGREIYECDIVEQLSERTYTSVKGIVKFVDGSYVIETLSGDDGVFLFDDVAYNEVLGNIYENPELLNDNDVIQEE